MRYSQSIFQMPENLSAQQPNWEHQMLLLTLFVGAVRGAIYWAEGLAIFPITFGLTHI